MTQVKENDKVKCFESGQVEIKANDSGEKSTMTITYKASKNTLNKALKILDKIVQKLCK